jgi:hypothetical protein
MMETEVIQRPNGKAYRPRKVIAYSVTDEYEEICGVLVLGTHDIARARVLADELVAHYVDSCEVAAEPETGWWRDRFESGRLRWAADEVRGRAGVLFQKIIEGGDG